MGGLNLSIDAPDVLGSLQRGVQFQENIRGVKQKRASEEAARQEALRTQKELSDFSSIEKPNGEDVARLHLRNPKLAEHIQENWKILNPAQQKTKLSQMTKKYAALEADDIDTTKRLINTEIEAARNSGDEREAKGLEAFLKQVEMDPKGSKANLAANISAIEGAEKFSKTLETLKKGQEGDKLTIKEKFGIALDTAEHYTEKSRNIALKTGDPTKLKLKVLSDNKTFTDDESKALDSWVRGFQVQQEFKESRDGFITSEKVHTLLSRVGPDGKIRTPNEVADSAAIMKLARAITGPGVLTESDKNSVVGNKSIMTEFTRMAKRAADGTILEEDREKMRKAARILQRKSSEDLDRFLSGHEKSFDARHGFGIDRIKKVTDPFRLSLKEEVKEVVETPEGEVQSFTTVEDATAAKLPVGTTITIGGRRAVIE